MSLGMELGLGPGDFVLNGDAAPPLQKGGGAEPPPQKNFGPCLLRSNGVMAEAGTWHGGRHRSRIRYLSKKFANFNEFSEIKKIRKDS